MHACIHTHAHTCDVHVCMQKYAQCAEYTYIRIIHTHLHDHVHTCALTYIHTYIHAYIQMGLHGYIRTSIHADVQTCMHTCMNRHMQKLCLHVRTCAYTYIIPHVRARTNTHTDAHISAHIHQRGREGEGREGVIESFTQSSSHKPLLRSTLRNLSGNSRLTSSALATLFSKLARPGSMVRLRVLGLRVGEDSVVRFKVLGLSDMNIYIYICICIYIYMQGYGTLWASSTIGALETYPPSPTRDERTKPCLP